MSPNEVVERLSMLGIQITRRTVLNYENGGLIQKAERGGGGTGGRWANYKKTVIAEIYAAWSLIHGQYIKNDLEGLNEFFDSKPPKFTPKIIALVREWYIAEEKVNACLCDSAKIADMNNLPVDYDVKAFQNANIEAVKRIQSEKAECRKILSKIPKEGYSLIVWVKELWEIERNKAIILEEELIKTLE